MVKRANCKELIAPLDFARQIGVSHSVLYRAIASGRISTYTSSGARLRPGAGARGKFVWPDEARQEWETNRCKERGGGGATLMAARTRKIKADAALRELQLSVKQGELVPAEAVT